LRRHRLKIFNVFIKVEQFRRSYKQFMAESSEIAALAAGGALGIKIFYIRIQPIVNFLDFRTNLNTFFVFYHRRDSSLPLATARVRSE